MFKTEIIKYLIRERGLTQGQVASLVGLSTSIFNKIIHNRKGTTTDRLAKFCQVLECQPGQILEYRPD